MSMRQRKEIQEMLRKKSINYKVSIYNFMIGAKVRLQELGWIFRKHASFAPASQSLLGFRLRSPLSEEPCPLSLHTVFSIPNLIQQFSCNCEKGNANNYKDILGYIKN